MTTTYRGLPPDLAQRSKPPPMVSKARMTTCAMCAQSFDLSHMGQVYHHNDEPHAPLPPGVS